MCASSMPFHNWRMRMILWGYSMAPETNWLYSSIYPAARRAVSFFLPKAIWNMHGLIIYWLDGNYRFTATPQDEEFMKIGFPQKAQFRIWNWLEFTLPHFSFNSAITGMCYIRRSASSLKSHNLTIWIRIWNQKVDKNPTQRAWHRTFLDNSIEWV